MLYDSKVEVTDLPQGYRDEVLQVGSSGFSLINPALTYGIRNYSESTKVLLESLPYSLILAQLARPSDISAFILTLHL